MTFHSVVIVQFDVSLALYLLVRMGTNNYQAQPSFKVSQAEIVILSYLLHKLLIQAA